MRGRDSLMRYSRSRWAWTNTTPVLAARRGNGLAARPGVPPRRRHRPAARHSTGFVRAVLAQASRAAHATETARGSARRRAKGAWARPECLRQARAVGRDGPGLAGLAAGPFQQEQRFPVVDMGPQAGQRRDAASGVGVSKTVLVGKRLPAPVRPPVRFLIPGRPVGVPRCLATAPVGPGVLQHRCPAGAGADPPDPGTQTSIVREIIGADLARLDPEALQQLFDPRRHPHSLSRAHRGRKSADRTA